MVTNSTYCRSQRPGQRLTQRETEVAALIAQGLKNYSIARRLSLSPATVATYVQRIQSRLGVSGREHISRWVTTTSDTPDPQLHSVQSAHATRVRLPGTRPLGPAGWSL